MHDQRSPAGLADEAATDRMVLDLLLNDDSQRPWSLDEIVRELGDREDAGDALARLHGAGLVHRLDGFVFAARPAVHAARLGED